MPTKARNVSASRDTNFYLEVLRSMRLFVFCFFCIALGQQHKLSHRLSPILVELPFLLSAPSSRKQQHTRRKITYYRPIVQLESIETESQSITKMQLADKLIQSMLQEFFLIFQRTAVKMKEDCKHLTNNLHE